MSSFKEFMDEAEKSPATEPNMSISAIQDSLTLAVSSILTPFAIPNDKKQKFSEQASDVVRDKVFISEFSDRIGEPTKLETEDDFVERGSDILRRMLYDKFGIKG